MMTNSAKIDVLIISKPLAPPWNDGSKNLIRNLIKYSSETVEYHVPVIEANRSNFLKKISIFTTLFRERNVPIAHFLFAPNLISSLGARIGLIFDKKLTVHTILSRPSSFNGIKKLLFAKKIITTSDHTKRELLFRGIADVQCIYPGVPVAEKRIEASEKRLAKQKLGFPDDPIVLFGGDYEFSTGAQTLARAIPAVLKQIKVTFVFACRMKTHHALLKKKQIEKDLAEASVLESVKFIDPVPSMNDLLTATDLQLMHQESYYAKLDIPLVLLEGFSFGIPAILAKGSPPEELLRFYDCALTVHPTDAESLSQAIISALRDRERFQKMSEAALKLIETKLNISTMVDSYLQIYGELLEENYGKAKSI